MPMFQYLASLCATPLCSAVLSLISWIKMSVASGIPLLKRFAVRIAEGFNDILHGIRYGTG